MRTRRRQLLRHYGRRKPNDYVPTQPGDLGQVDTLVISLAIGPHLKHFGLIDVVSRSGLVDLHVSAAATTASENLERMLMCSPFAFNAIQVDGSEFMAEELCQQRGIGLCVVPPRSLKLAGRVERFQRTHQNDFYGCADEALDVDTLRVRSSNRETIYDTIPPHQSLGMLTQQNPLGKLPPIGEGTCPRGVAHVPNHFTRLTLGHTWPKIVYRMARRKPAVPQDKAALASIERTTSIRAFSLRGRRNWRPSLLILAAAASIVAAVSILAAYDLFAPAPDHEVVLPYNDFKDQLKSHNIAALTTLGTRIEGVTCTAVTEPATHQQATKFTTALPSFGDPELEALVEATPGCHGHRVSINAEPVAFRWDFIISATPLSTFAAILAGFVIVAVATILSFPKEGSIPAHIPLQPLLTAFLTLVVAAFLFAVLAGSPPGGGDRLLPLAQGYAISWVLVFGILQTAVGIAWLMKHFVVDESALRAARWVVHVSILVLAVAIAGAITQPLYVLYPDRAYQDGAAWAILGAVPLVAIPVGIWFNTDRSHELLTQLTRPAMALVVAGFICSGVLLGMTEEDARNGYKLLFSSMVAAQAVLAGVFILYEASLPVASSKGHRAQTAG